MDNGCDELDLLSHTLGKFLYFLVPPALYAELHEPFLKFLGSFSL